MRLTISHSWRPLAVAGRPAQRLRGVMDMDAILDLVVTGCAALGVLFMQLGVGTSIDLEMVRTSFRAPVSILIGFACQFGMMPALAYTACILADFEGYTAIGLILICSAPGGTMSNAVVPFAGGDAALSVMMTLCSSVLAFGVWPALTVLYSQRFTVDQDVNIPLEHIVLSVAMSCVPVPIGAYLQVCQGSRAQARCVRLHPHRSLQAQCGSLGARH